MNDSNGLEANQLTPGAPGQEQTFRGLQKCGSYAGIFIVKRCRSIRFRRLAGFFAKRSATKARASGVLCPRKAASV